MFKKFTFDTQYVRNQFTAEYIGDYKYKVSWSVGESIYNIERVRYWIEGGYWTNVQEIKNNQPFFSIKEGSIESAARFIVANNNYKPYANTEEAENSIKRNINRMIEQIKNGKDAYRCSTAGWTILIDKEDKDYYVVEVTVDPSVSQDREFVNVEEII